MLQEKYIKQFTSIFGQLYEFTIHRDCVKSMILHRENNIFGSLWKTKE